MKKQSGGFVIGMSCVCAATEGKFAGDGQAALGSLPGNCSAAISGVTNGCSAYRQDSKGQAGEAQPAKRYSAQSHEPYSSASYTDGGDGNCAAGEESTIRQIADGNLAPGRKHFASR